MPVIPAMGMMVITMIIVGLVTTRQRKTHHKGAKPKADEVLYLVFHPIKVSITLPKTLPGHYILNLVDISPQIIKNATKVV
jgi:hypothetical protein